MSEKYIKISIELDKSLSDYFQGMYGGVWTDKDTIFWSNFDHKELTKKSDSLSELLFASSNSEFSAMKQINNDVFYAIVSMPVLGLLLKNQDIFAVSFIRTIPWYIFVLASIIGVGIRMNYIVDPNKDVLDLNYVSTNILQKLHELKGFSAFTQTDEYTAIMKKEGGFQDIIDLNIVKMFYDYRSS